MTSLAINRTSNTQVTLNSAYLGMKSDREQLAGVVESLISAQVTGIAVGQNPDQVPSDYFRLSTGVYDAANLGGVEVRQGQHKPSSQ